MAFKATILADSISSRGHRVTTMEIVFPRIVLSEFNTHRMLSRNTASSRAIPVDKQIERVMSEPFIPHYWGAREAGMQATSEIDEADIEQAKKEWLAARDDAVRHAKALLALNVHKQLTNRIFEPFMWHTAVVSGTEWSNFFSLRNNKEAQPEIHAIAELMQAACESSDPTPLGPDDWHLPLIQPEEYDGMFEHTEEARKIAAARCARVSYLTHDGRRDQAADLALYERLTSSGHMSPLEHVARPLSDAEFAENEWRGNFHGWMQLRKLIPYEHDYSLVEEMDD